MALPADVSTFRFSFGPYFKDDGSPDYVGMTGTVRPSKSRYHDGTGGEITTTPDSVVIGADGTATSDLHPHSDVASLTPEVLFIVEWDTDSPRTPSPGNRRVYVPAVMGTVVDFDSLQLADTDPSISIPVLDVAMQATVAAQAAQVAAVLAQQASSAAYGQATASAASAGEAARAADAAAASAAISDFVVSPNLSALPPLGGLVQTGLGSDGTGFTLWFDDGM